MNPLKVFCVSFISSLKSKVKKIRKFDDFSEFFDQVFGIIHEKYPIPEVLIEMLTELSPILHRYLVFFESKKYDEEKLALKFQREVLPVLEKYVKMVD